MPRALVLATAGLKPNQLDDRENLIFPRVDYLDLKRFIDVEVINYDVYDRTKLGRFFRNLETQVRSDIYLTLLGLDSLKKHSLVFTMSERAGIPLAGFKKFLPHQKHLFTMFQSWSKRQENVISNFKLFQEMDTVAVHCQSMKKHLASLGFSPEKIVTLPYSVDEDFFASRKDVDQEKNLIVSVGEPRSRNYPLLFGAVEDLPVRLVAAASGWWYAREKERNVNGYIPPNVEIVKHLLPASLRTLYARSSFVVLPVYDQISSAGITGIMEAGYMERCVIVTRSRGIKEFIIDGETGLVIDPDNPAALREAIRYLISNPGEARRMGRNARQYFECVHNWDNYVSSMAQVISNNLARSS
jgi:glycosyltransferase involved in cell wall biosynthesis